MVLKRHPFTDKMIFGNINVISEKVTFYRKFKGPEANMHQNSIAKFTK